MKKLAVLLLSLMFIFACAGSLAEEMPRRTVASMLFELAEGEEQYMENMIFTTDVVVIGEHAQIVFSNCEFLGNITLHANEATRVMLLGCDVYGQCVLHNDIREANMDWPMAKFMSDTPIEVVTNDGVCNIILLGDVDANIDGTGYTLADSQYYLDMTNPEAGMPPYEGQPSSYYCVAQWWENGEKIVMSIAQYEGEM